MESIQKDPDPKVYDYLVFCTARKEGVPDEQISKRFGFQRPETLYHKLRRDGFPVCERCGDYSPGGKYCNKRQARGGWRARRTGQTRQCADSSSTRRYGL